MSNKKVYTYLHSDGLYPSKYVVLTKGMSKYGS